MAMAYIGCLKLKDILLLHKIGIECWWFTTTDEAIDIIRTKYNVVIYNKATPFVDSSGKIIYNFAAKCCNPKFGWNGRTYIDTPSKWDSNIYEAKRRAIRAAARWILAHKCQKNKYQITQKWKKQRKKELIQAFGLV